MIPYVCMQLAIRPTTCRYPQGDVVPGWAQFDAYAWYMRRCAHQVKISNLQKELAAAREALHERHRDEEGEEEGEERRGAGRAGRRAELRRVAGGVGGTPAKIKSLSWNFPTSSEPTELKETASVKVRRRVRVHWM